MFNLSRHLEEQKKKARYEKITNYKDKVKTYQEGKGSFIYQNNTSGTLILPKISAEGKSSVEKGENWSGDDYYMNMVSAGEALLVEVIQDKEQKMENINEEKLILDQPETITEKGVVEQIVVSPLAKVKKAVSLTEEEIPEDILLNEDPLAGVEILG